MAPNTSIESALGWAKAPHEKSDQDGHNDTGDGQRQHGNDNRTEFTCIAKKYGRNKQPDHRANDAAKAPGIE
jgi:hypothetical protein